MKKLAFTFAEDVFNNLFPFFILIDSDLLIRGIGKSLHKIYPNLKVEESFSSHFSIQKLHNDTPNFKDLKKITNQLVILQGKSDGLILRGQFELMDEQLLFTGSPWFISKEQVFDKQLTANDFAYSNPLFDLLDTFDTYGTDSFDQNESLEILKHQQEKLKNDQDELNRISLVASTNGNGVVFTELDGSIFWCNDSYLKLTGYNKEEVMGISTVEVGFCKYTNVDELSKMTTPFFKGEPFNVEIVHGRKDGSFFWAKIKGQPVLNEDGKVTHYFAMIEDITQKKEQEERLYLLSLIAEKNINPVVICDKHGRIEWVNESFLELSEYTFEEAIGQVPGHLLQGPDTCPETVEYLKNKVLEGKSFECEIVNYSKSGVKYWIRLQGQALLDRRGKISKFFAIEEDITAKKALENQKEELLESLAKSNKDLEDYASIVSHDLKSPLRSIHSLLTWIKEDNDKEFNEQTLKYLTMIEGKVEKMDHLIGGILTYAKIDKGDFVEENVNVHQIIQSIISIIDIPKNVDVIIKNQLPFIKADRFRIQQLFQNIIGNAVIYVDKPEGLVEVGSVEHDDHYVFFIKDNGPGIAKENQEKIFNVFQSFTKSDRSTGIGLSIVKKIIETYNGKIWIESELGTGTTFFIKLNK